MQLDRFPHALGGDAHFLVVVTGRAAGSESIAQPEAVFQRQAVGDIRKRRGTLVGGNDQIRVVSIAAHNVFGRHDFIALAVVGDIQKATNKGLVALDTLFEIFLAVLDDGFDHEATLGAHRYDHGVFHHLRLHKAENLGAEILVPVRPAQTAACDHVAAQVNGLYAGRIDENLN